MIAQTVVTLGVVPHVWPSASSTTSNYSLRSYYALMEHSCMSAITIIFALQSFRSSCGILPVSRLTFRRIDTRSSPA